MRRTVLRSSKGMKLYAVRDSKGRFRDIQRYKRAHGMDIKRRSKAEIAAKRAAARKKTAGTKKKTSAGRKKK